MNVQYNIITVEDEFNHVKLFVDKAWEYKNDFSYILAHDPRLKNFKNLLKFSKDKYVLVKGEQIIRPIHFFKIGGDCDNQLVFILAWLFYKYKDSFMLGGTPADLFHYYIVRDFGKKNQAHIYLAYSDKDFKESKNKNHLTHEFDLLPKKYQYTQDKIFRSCINNLTDYLY